MAPFLFGAFKAFKTLKALTLSQGRIKEIWGPG